MKQKYAFIVGAGDLPKMLVESAIMQNIDFVIAGIQGVSDKSFIKDYTHFWFALGQVGALLKSLAIHGITHVVIAGALQRPSLFALKVDQQGFDILKRLRKAKGDNSLLSLIIQEFEDRGFIVVGAHEVAPDILSKARNYTPWEIPDTIKSQLADAWRIAKQIGNLDIGQSIVYQSNIVIAVEGVEGTSQLISRCKKLLKDNGKNAFLLKVSKENQDFRIDLPTIGDKTIIAMKKARLQGLIIEAGKTIIVNQEKTLKLANKHGIFIVAL